MAIRRTIAAHAKTARNIRARTNGDAARKAPRSSLFVNSVEKAMVVLKAFDASRPRLTLSQIAAVSDMDLSGAQRFTYTLVNLGYLRKDEATRTYELSPQVFEFTYHYLNSSELVNRASPYVHQLSLQTDETANITVLHGSNVVFVFRIVSMHVLSTNTIVGSSIPAYCSAPGLAMMAHLPPEQVEHILASSDLVQHTPYTIAQPRSIRERLAAIRKAGYAHAEEEYFLGDISTAAAILGADGKVLGAINVAVAKPRWKGERDERRIADLVVSTAAAISRR